MIHPDDVNAVRDWMLYGPKSSEMHVLVERLAETGMRLADIEALLEQALRAELAKREAATTPLD
jgi:hypothetical protein